MNIEIINTAFSIPDEAYVDQRVPKKMLLEQDIPTSADKRHIREGVDEIRWIAALKPNNIGIPEYKDDLRDYSEISILTMKLRQIAKHSRLVEITHRMIPYPLVLISIHGKQASLSLAHKRWSQNEAGKVVVDRVHCIGFDDFDISEETTVTFLNSLAISKQPSTSLFSVYQGWLDCIAAFEAAKITGKFTLPISGKRSKELQKALDEYAELQKNINTLQVQAEKEKQLNRRVDLNLKIKQLQAELADNKDRIGGNKTKGEEPKANY